MTYARHGGGCCGIGHIYNLDNMTVDILDSEIERHFSEDTARGERRVVEIILSSRQVVTPPPAGDRRFAECVRTAGGWPVVLAARGFVLTESFVNSNTGNTCYRFILIRGGGLNPNDRETPFTWTGGRVEHRVSPEIVTINVPVTLAVGDSVRVINPRAERNGQLGRVTAVGNTRATVTFEDGRISTYDRTSLQKVNVVAGMPYPVNPDLPMEVVADTGEVFPVGRTLAYPTARPEDGLCRLVRFGAAEGWFHLDDGQWGRRNPRYRLRNTAVPTVTVPPEAPALAPAADPVVRLTEYFAQFRSGRRSGPYPTQEAVRENNPRVLSFVTRVILSDGTVTEEVSRF